jgi:hypothetical protein
MIIFVSHSSKDARYIETYLLPLIKDAGDTPWYSAKEIKDWEDWAACIRKGLEECDALMLVVSPDAMSSDYVQKEIGIAAARQVPILPVEVRETSRRLLPSVVAAVQICPFRGPAPSLPERKKLSAALFRCIKNRPAEKQVTSYEFGKEEEPYLGAEPFGPEERSRLLFFGRDEEAGDIVRAFTTGTRLLALFAPSGSGKTSLANTLVRHRLEQEQFRVSLLRPGRIDAGEKNAPPGNRLTRGCYASLSQEEQAILASDGDPSMLKLVQSLQQTGADGRLRRHLLVFDQFEEIFTSEDQARNDLDGSTQKAPVPPAGELGDGEDETVNQDAAENDTAESFLNQLQDAFVARENLHFMFISRKEFIYDTNEALRRFNDGRQPGYYLRPFGETAARHAIRDPAFQMGVTFDEDAVELLLAYLTGRHGFTATPGRARHRELEIEPIILSLVCQRLWRYIEKAKVRVVLAHHVQALLAGRLGVGRFSDELLRHVEEAIKAVVDKVAVCSEPSVVRAFDFFIRRNGNRFSRGEVRRTGEHVVNLPMAAVAVLQERHLLRGEYRLGEKWYELIHDRFLEPVQKLIDNTEAVRSVLRLSRAIHLVHQTDPAITGKECHFSYHKELCDLAQKNEASIAALTVEELVTVFRCCLQEASTQYLLSVAAQLGSTHGKWELVLEHLENALTLGLGPEGAGDEDRRKEQAGIREAAARLIGQGSLIAATFDGTALAARWAGLMQALERCAAEDRESEVVAQAVRALGRLDSRAMYDRFVSLFVSYAPFRERFAQLVEWRLRQGNPDELRGAIQRLPNRLRWTLRGMVWARRLSQGSSRLAFMGVLTAGMASLFSCLVHWLPALYCLSFPQTMILAFHPAGLVQSIYFGITGGVTWGVTMTLTLGLCWIVFFPGRAYSASLLRVVSIISGALGGLVGGVLISALIILVFGRNELHLAGWDVHPDETPYEGFSAFRETWSSGIPLVFPAMGLMMGIGIGSIASWLRVSRQGQKNNHSLFGTATEPSLFLELINHSQLAAVGLYVLCLSSSAFVMPYVKRHALFHTTEAVTPAGAKRTFEWPWSTLVLKYLGESLVLAGGGWAVSVSIASGYLVPKYELPMESMDE